ncbi:MAG TPA: nucleotidyl transferase AbiEii/AbiGii toxin family protein [bacterium]|nr:nucleotidyl transferase AbiEii/AbiGii toxin family protein [bacterium]HOM26752.1 nucleotidyl transferase AbiEii/AbiGii toxin family protein [bacterium]
MERLINQEKFEIEVLEYLNSGKFFDKLVFVGGTMLRVCYGLNRFSSDLDFWIIKKIDIEKYFMNLENHLKKRYFIKDCVIKLHTILFEIHSPYYKKNLKIEIRKEIKRIKYEKTIAFSQYSDIQVLVNTLYLKDTLRFKIESFLDRGEIRDCFDIEFLGKKGNISAYRKKCC